MTDSAERAAFEAWYEAYCMPGEADWFRRDPEDPDEYDMTNTSSAWAAWQARASAPIPAGEPLTCGHPAELMLKSAETGADLYCELCDALQRARDAEAMEAELRETVANLSAELKKEIEPQVFMGEPVVSYVRSRNGCQACKARLEDIERSLASPPAPPAHKVVPLSEEQIEALELALIAECERAMKQRDEFLRTGVSTAAHHGASHDTCLGHILRAHGIEAALSAAPSDPKDDVHQT
jgi:hypothetical protein